MGLLATGISCLAQVNVKGLSRVPLPPLKTSAFIVYLIVEKRWVLMACYKQSRANTVVIGLVQSHNFITKTTEFKVLSR